VFAHSMHTSSEHCVGQERWPAQHSIAWHAHNHGRRQAVTHRTLPCRALLPCRQLINHYYFAPQTLCMQWQVVDEEATAKAQEEADKKAAEEGKEAEKVAPGEWSAVVSHLLLL